MGDLNSNRVHPEEMDYPNPKSPREGAGGSSPSFGSDTPHLYNAGGINVERKTQDIVQGVFELKYLVLFTKCTNLCTSTQIHLKNDYPLVLRYMVANLGEVRLVLAPQKQKTDMAGRAQKV
jgi:hypothetical protein